MPDDTPAPEERIAVSPARIDYGAVSVNTQGDATRSLTIYNLGDDDVTVTGQDEPIGDEEFRIDASPVLAVAAGEQVTLFVHFVPRTEAASFARLRFEPGSEVVELVGEGTAPVLRTDAPDLPPTVLGCSAEGTVLVHNDGSEALTLDAQVTGDDFAVVGWEADLAPGESAPVTLSFTPGGGGERAGVLTLTSNDPEQPEFAVPLSALGYEGSHVTETYVYAPAAPTDVVVAAEGVRFADDERLAPALEAYAEQLVAAQVDVRVTSVPTAGPCTLRAPLWAELGDSALRIGTVLENGFEGAAGPWDDDLVGLVETVLWHAESGGCLDGFRRPDTDLEVILVADTPPAEDPLAAWELVRAGLAEDQRVRIHVLVADGDACTGAEAYIPLATAYDGTVGNLCGTSWAEAFTAFAAFPLAPREMRYPLSEVPVESTLTLRIDGVPSTDWTWDAAANAIVLDVEHAPDFGAELELEYVSAVSCTP